MVTVLEHAIVGGLVTALHGASAFGWGAPLVTRIGSSSSFAPRARRDIGLRLSMARQDGPLGLGSILGVFAPPEEVNKSNGAAAAEAEQVVKLLIAAINTRNDPSEMMQFFSGDICFVDASFYNPIEGKVGLSRHFRLHAGSSPMSTLAADSSEAIVIDDIVSMADDAAGLSVEGTSKVCVRYHLETSGGEKIPDTTGITFYNLRGGSIERVFHVTEPPSPKPADSGLKLLGFVSDLIGDESIVTKDVNGSGEAETMSVVERYFDAWNRRDMDDAVSLFAEDCEMRDLQYPGAFLGREQFGEHLARVRDCLPSSFDFVVDDLAIMPTKVGVLWHVENDGDPLAFTRGCSFYTIDESTGLIKTGFEIPEKAPPKLGFLKTVSNKLQMDPIRLVPLGLWIAYMYILFISDGILPGANALALEQRTWEEVRDLSLNFFLVAPALKLPFSPVVHPMLEGVFNLLLSWAAMFAGFLSDERKDKPNLLPMAPMLVGMQFLTSGFLLPYLFTRTPESSTQVSEEDIDGDFQRLLAEWRPLGILLGGVGSVSILWGLFARADFGNFAERYSSFVDLLSIDRVGSSFIVDLVIFAAFQGWFIDDDLRRRGVKDSDLAALRNAAKFIPFFGMAAYLVLRPPLRTGGNLR